MLQAFQYRRLAGMILLLLAGFGWLGCRLYGIQVRRHRELAQKSEQFTRALRLLEPWRGQIRDRNGKVLAISGPEKTVYLNLAVAADHRDQAARTAGALLGLSAGEVARRARSHLSGTAKDAARAPAAVVLKHHVSVAEWQAIASALELEAFGYNLAKLTPREKAELNKLRHHLLFARDTQTRFYPWGECLSHVVGFAARGSNGIGLEGKCGIEKTYNALLAGTFGRCVSRQDAAGHELPQARTEHRLPADGGHVVLTVDLRLQQILERALCAGRAQSQARAASALLMDPRTGEILALASLPNFNAQDPGAAAHETWRNPVLGDNVEPGSAFKTITLAAALDLRLLTLESGIYCEKGRFTVNGVTVGDHAPYGLLSARDCFAKSSNIAFAKIALALGPSRFYRYMTNFGFGQSTGLPFFGATPGRIEPPQNWSTMALTRAAFGQGLSVSQLQMAAAVSAIANNGRLMRPLLVRQIESSRGDLCKRFGPQFLRNVVSPQTAQQVREAMKAVVAPGGTGAQAAPAGYSLAAKTGTAQKSNADGYLNGCYYSSMVGFLPADAPQIVIAVALDEPRNGYYAGAVVAPIFRSIAEQAAVCLGIPPDKAPPAPGVKAQAKPRATVTPAPATRPGLNRQLTLNHALAGVSKQ